MSMLVLAGSDYNLLARSGATVTPSPAADALFPVAALYDRDPGTIFKFGSLTADPTITLDLGETPPNGDFEDAFVGGLPTAAWGKTSGATLTRNASTPRSGAGCLQASGDLAEYGYFDLAAHAGAAFIFQAAARTVGGNCLAQVRVRNLHTGSMLKSDGTWSATPIEFLSTSATSYSFSSQAATVETPESGPSVMTLRVELVCHNQGGDTPLYDDVALFFGVDFASLHGHNLDPLVVVELRSSTDGFSGSNTLEATLTKRRGAFYGKLASVVCRRYWRLKFVGTNSAAIYLGEWVLGAAYALAQPPGYPFAVELLAPQIRVPLPYGAPAVYGVGLTVQPASLGLSFGFNGDAALAEFQREVFERSLDGSPLVLVPDDSKPEVYLVRCPDRMSRPRTGWTFHQVEMVFESLRLPLVVA